METPILKRSCIKSDNFLKTGFNYIEQKTGGLNPRIFAVSLGAKFTPEEKEMLSKNNADAILTSDLTKVLPYRVAMSNALKKRGYPVPSNIADLTNSFYSNVVKNSTYAKHYQHVEGNPILRKLNSHADATVITSLIPIIPAATSYINYATNTNDPTIDAQLIQDAQDIVDFIHAKQNGQATDNLPVGSFAVNYWFIAIFVVLLILIFKK